MEEIKDYAMEIQRQWYKKEGDVEPKASYSVKISTLGGYILLKPTANSFRSLSYFAFKHPELVVDRNKKEEPVIVKPKTV